jgi:hypothetical protein
VTQPKDDMISLVYLILFLMGESNMQNIFNSNVMDPENTLTKVLNTKQSISFEQMFNSLKPSIVGLN